MVGVPQWNDNHQRATVPQWNDNRLGLVFHNGTTTNDLPVKVVATVFFVAVMGKISLLVFRPGRVLTALDRAALLMPH
jgi:hypothetical protein